MQGEPPTEASTSTGAVFVSYASQDGNAAQRICDALRTAGIEVWFDQSELRGGEVWDRRIRDQIHRSRLFIAVISAATEARDEGYFRREWKMAVDRTHDMADTKTFLVPVVIDGTPQRGASVPEKFHELHWTRLPGGEASPAFVARVQRLLALEPTPAQAARAPTGSTTGPASTPPPRRSWRRDVGLWTVVALLVAALLILLVDRFLLPKSPPWRTRSASQVTDQSVVVVSDFANTTADPAFDGALRQLLIVELGKSPQLSVLSAARIGQTLRRMLRPPDTKLTAEVASEICERTASGAVVEGSVSSLGSKYLVGVRVTNCRTGTVVDQEQAPAEKEDDVFNQLAQMTEQVRTRVGDLLPRIEKEPGVLTDVTTPSLAAWRSYNAAVKAIQSKADAVESVSLLKRAIEIDPKFAMAYALVGRVYDGLGQSELGAQSIATAYELRDLVGDQENFFITFNYTRQVPRNLEMARQTLESWIRKYPGDMSPHSFLSGLTSPGTGHHERAAEEGQRAIELDPDFAVPYYNAAFAYLYLNRVSEAEALLHKASDRKLEVPQFSLLRYFIAFLRNDPAAMEREANQRKTVLEAQGWFEHQEALTLAYQGRLHEANRLSERAVILARQGGLPERAAMFVGARAVWNALYGIQAEALSSSASAVSLFRGRDADYGPAVALALLGHLAEAQKIVVNLEKRYPEDTSVQFSYLPTLRALDALNSGDAAKAVELTQSAAGYELAVPAAAYLGAFFGTLYPVYVRGLAYSRAGRYGEAAIEFQKILDHPGLVLNDPIGPMARLQMARALSASGDRAKSAAVYKDLLALWQRAAPDISVFNQAKAEYAKLQ